MRGWGQAEEDGCVVRYLSVVCGLVELSWHESIIHINPLSSKFLINLFPPSVLSSGWLNQHKVLFEISAVFRVDQESS